MVANKYVEKVEDSDILVQDISKAYRSEGFTDISFVLSDGVTIETNRFMLAWRSDYFASMLFGGLKEGSSDKVVLQCSSKSFRLILDYIWEGKVDFSQLNLQALLDLMENARMMCLDRLVGRINDYLTNIIKNNEVDFGESLVLLDFCAVNKFQEMEKLVLGFVGLNFSNVTSHSKFSMISAAAILAILKYEAKTSSEIEIFNALASWIESQVTPLSASTKSEMLSLVNLFLIDSTSLLKIVRKSGLYEEKTICDALEKQLDMENVNVNVCLEENGAKIIHGIVKSEGIEGSCIRGPPHFYGGQSGYTFNRLGERITVKFQKEYMINKVKFLLWNLDDRKYSYILESSLDGKNWSTVLDCTEKDCSSQQTIFFPAKPMKFISVKGSSNSYLGGEERNNFHIVNILATLDTTDLEKKNSGMVLKN